MTPAAQAHLLRLLISCRKLTAQVTAGATDIIVAMASSGEQEFAAAIRARLYRYPHSRRFWDERVAARVGEKLAVRLSQIGVSDVRLHFEDGDRKGISLPLHYRRPIASLFHSVERAGVRIDGADEIRCDRDPQAGTFKIEILAVTVGVVKYLMQRRRTTKKARTDKNIAEFSSMPLYNT